MAQLLAIDQLPSRVTDQALVHILSAFPNILRSHVLADADGHSLGAAVVEVADASSREVLIEALDGLEILGQPIKVSRLDLGQGLAA